MSDSIDEKVDPDAFLPGDLLWTKLGDYPFWPSMVTYHPTTGEFKKRNNKHQMIYHVQYFGPGAMRGWTQNVFTSCLPFQGEEEYSKRIKTLKAHSKSVAKYKIQDLFKINWKIAVQNAEEASLLTNIRQRFENYVYRFNEEIKPSNATDSTINSNKSNVILEPSSSKKNCIDSGICSSCRGYNVEFSCSGTCESSFHLDCYGLKKRVKSLRCPDCLSDDQSAVSSKCFKCNLNTNEVLFNCAILTCGKKYHISCLNKLDGAVAERRICPQHDGLTCFKYDKNNVLACTGKCFKCNLNTNEVLFNCAILTCGKKYHISCLNELDGAVAERRICPQHDGLTCFKDNSNNSLACTDDQSAVSSKCFKCNLNTNEVLFKCAISTCDKQYHISCLHELDGAVTERRICPQHACLTCFKYDKNNVLAYTGTLVRCVKCPFAFHNQEKCIPPGAFLQSELEIICPLHYGGKSKVSPMPTCNMNSCSICHHGGELVCCETCPNALHKDCIPPPIRVTTDDDDYKCPPCLNGDYLHNGMIVWVAAENRKQRKPVGSSVKKALPVSPVCEEKWWPAKIIYPSDIPEHIKSKKHHEGEFVVKFYGSSQYSWTHTGRVFEYTKDHLELKAASIDENDKKLKTAYKAAAKAFRGTLPDGKNYSPISQDKYKHINACHHLSFKLTNKRNPLPDPCECDASKACGPESSCANLTTLIECHPKTCPVKDLCKNQRFQRQQYASIKVERINNCGWGLIAVNAIAKDDFVIEYVGEIITTKEYNKRAAEIREKRKANSYFLYLDSKRMIDAERMGNLSRFINHSCDPNCHMKKWSVNGDIRVGIFALRNILPGEEITFNYNCDENYDFEQECFCGAKDCSGYIGRPIVKPYGPRKRQKIEKILPPPPTTTNKKKTIEFSLSPTLLEDGVQLIKLLDMGMKVNFGIPMIEKVSDSYITTACAPSISEAQYTEVCARIISESSVQAVAAMTTAEASASGTSETSVEQASDYIISDSHIEASCTPEIGVTFSMVDRVAYAPENSVVKQHDESISAPIDDSENHCFICHKPGKLIICDEIGCIRAYHNTCLGLATTPKGKWICPIHQCSRCQKVATVFCKFCPMSICKECWVIDVPKDKKFICQFCRLRHKKKKK